LIRACLANGQPEAAEHLASRGAPLDFAGAAGLGRVDVLREFFDAWRRQGQTVASATVADALWLASGYGHAGAARFLIAHGAHVDMELRGHGEGHTALHAAAYYGHPDVLSLLLERGARVDVIDKTWETPPLVWALTGWSSAPAAKAERYYRVVAALVRAGAQVRSSLLESEKVRADPKMIAALGGNIR
jgi:ankyrin repeat protein